MPVEPDVVTANDQFKPLEPSILPAHVDRIVIIDETDFAVAQPHPFTSVRGTDGKKRCGECYGEF